MYIHTYIYIYIYGGVNPLGIPIGYIIIIIVVGGKIMGNRGNNNKVYIRYN